MNEVEKYPEPGVDHMEQVALFAGLGDRAADR
jgi:hypothetical protein